MVRPIHPKLLVVGSVNHGHMLAALLSDVFDVQLLEAIEEEVKKRGAVKAAKYTGPLLRTRSLQVDGAALVSLCSFLPG